MLDYIDEMYKFAVIIIFSFFIIYFYIKKVKIPILVYMYIAMIPYNYVIALELNIIDKVLEIGIAFSLIKILYEKRGRIKVMPSLIVYFASIFLSVLYAAIRKNDINVLLRSQELRFFFGILMVVIILINIIDSQKKLIHLLVIFQFNTLFLSIGGYIDAYMRGSILDFSHRFRFTLDINFYAIYLLVGILVYITSCNFKYRNSGKLTNKSMLQFAYILFCGSALLRTRSSSIYVCIVFLAVLGICYLYNRYNKRMVKYITNMLILSILGISIFLSMNKYEDLIIIPKLTQMMGRDWDTTRYVIWNSAYEVFLKNPIFGLEPGSFRYAYKIDVNFITHNDYLKILAETGLLGMFAFCIYLSSIFKKIFKISDNTTKYYCISLIMVMLIFMLMHNYITYAVFWVVIAFIYIYCNLLSQKNKASAVCAEKFSE